MSVPPLAAVALLTLAVGCAGATASTRALPTPDASTVDPLFRDYAGPDSPGASVVVFDDGQVEL